jgi:hypothetical protein
MERQRGRQEANPIPNRACRQTFRSTLNEEPVDRQSMFVGERP